MKKQVLLLCASTVIGSFLFTSCSNISLTSWKNPKENVQVSRVVIWGMFNKLEYEKPLEQSMASYFNSKGLKAIEALDFLDPNVKYELPVLEKKVDSIGADGIIIFTYKGTDKQEDYVPPTTTVYPDYYYNYYSFYNCGYPYWSPGYTAVTTGGYWTTTTIVNLQANLYANSSNNLLWTSAIQVTNPDYLDETGFNLAKAIYDDLLKNGLIKAPPK